MRALCVGALVAIGACASSQSSQSSLPAPGARQNIRVATPMGETDLSMVAGSSPSIGRVGAPIDRAWSMLPSVYDSLGIPIGMANSASHTVGNINFKARQHLGKSYLSKYLDCGQTQIGASADSYDVVLTVYTELQTVATDVTQITTTLSASARPPAFAQAYSNCTSTMVLEAKIIALLRARLQT